MRLKHFHIFINYPYQKVFYDSYMPFQSSNRGFCTYIGTLFIVFFTQSIEYCSLLIILFKTMLLFTQDNTTYPKNCIRPIITTIKAMEIKRIGLVLGR